MPSDSPVPRLFGWLHADAVAQEALAAWCAAAGATPVLRDGPLDLWTWPSGDAQPIDTESQAGLAYGAVYGVPATHTAQTLAEAHRTARLPALDGRFAAVLWDRTRQRLSLYRDASGGMFLFYRALSGSGPGSGLVFSDDLDRLVTAPGGSPAFGAPGLHEYLRFLDVSTPNCLYAGVRSPEPGVELVFAGTGGEPQVRGPAPGPAERPDSPKPAAGRTTHRKPKPGIDEAADRVESLLTAAVAKRLPPDGPVVAFLSGGLDSALIAALAARLAPGRVTAYTVGFHEAGFDETPVATAIARHLGLPHRVLRRPLADYRPAFDTLVRRIAYPFADPAFVPTLPVFEDCRALAPCALDGTGAEVCVGTLPPRHVRIATQYAAALPRPLRRGAALALGAMGPLARYRPILAFDDPEETLMRWRGWTRREVERLCGRPVSLAHTRFYRVYKSFPPHAHLPRYTALMAAMPDDRIHEICRLTGFEVRFPFFDPELAAYVTGLPVELRHPPGEPKRVLRHLLARHVPRAIWDLPKHGFDFPFADFLALDDYALVREHLDPERVAAAGLVDPGMVAGAVARFIAGDREPVFKVWGLVVLFAWLTHHWRPLHGADGPVPVVRAAGPGADRRSADTRLGSRNGCLRVY